MRWFAWVIVMLGLTAVAWAGPAAPLSALAKMPVQEVTVFKDGHAFVLHEGVLPTDAAGNVLMDYLPTPVLGTFWPYSADPHAKLSAVVASQRKVMIERTSLQLRDFLEANVGKKAIITEVVANVSTNPTPRYTATILGVPTRGWEELERTAPSNAGELLPVKGNVILLRTDDGTKVLPIDRVLDVTILDTPKATVSNEEFRNLLTMKMDWSGKPARQEARVGMMYLQLGLRWIPSYRVNLDGNGKASVTLEATLLNEMTDLRDVTANLVIGVPSFAFKDTLDPIGLGQSVAEVGARMEAGRTRNALSNAIMTQGMAFYANDGAYGRGAEASRPDTPRDLGPTVAGSEKAEDLFVFTVRHITLKKGERMVIPVAEYTLPYTDVYTLDIPFTPPAQVMSNISREQQTDLQRALSTQKVMHKIRLHNTGAHPLTTAPALILSKGQLIAQGMMTYASPKANSDITMTQAVEVAVSKSDTETKRAQSDLRMNGMDFSLVELAGQITLINHRAVPTEVEVTRNVLGTVKTADNQGVIEQVNIFEDHRFLPENGGPAWFNLSNWPYWWHWVNGVGRMTWKVKLAPNVPTTLRYTWAYYWH